MHLYDVNYIIVLHYLGRIGTNWSDIRVLASREYIQQGEKLFLVCLTRLTSITFTWFHKGKTLNSSKGVLQISNSSEATLGNYTCRATAEDASAVTSASIVVRRFGKYYLEYFHASIGSGVCIAPGV